MSALRLGRLEDGTRDVRIVDDGATPRHSSRLGIKGGYGNPIIGAFPVGKSQRTIDTENQRRLRENERSRERRRNARPNPESAA